MHDGMRVSYLVLRICLIGLATGSCGNLKIRYKEDPTSVQQKATPAVDSSQSADGNSKKAETDPNLVNPTDPGSKNSVPATVGATNPVAYLAYAEFKPYNDYVPYKAGTRFNLGTQAFCEKSPRHLSCRGTKIYCQDVPNASYCLGSIAFCQSNPTAKSCLGTVAFCEQTPLNQACNATIYFCQERPRDLSCKGTQAHCFSQPQDQACKNTPIFCEENPQADQCLTTEPLQCKTHSDPVIEETCYDDQPNQLCLEICQRHFDVYCFCSDQN